VILLNGIRFSENGRRIDYDYVASGPAAKFFQGCPSFFVQYDEDVSGCPQAIAIIPFVANILPIAWFAGFAVRVSEIDRIFAQSMIRLREEFRKMYPGHALSGALEAQRLIDVEWRGNRRFLLFSGGLDAFTSLVRHRDEDLELVTLLGADIDLSDVKQWNECQRHINEEPLLQRFPRHVIASNLQTFYTREVEIRLVFIWWGKVQHGLGMLGLLAPLSQLRGCGWAYIASSVPGDAWGSSPQTDSCIRWGSLVVENDGVELGRQGKADFIVRYVRESGEQFTLRVCYSEVSKDLNCGRCEKCYRTMMNLILANHDPRQFGVPFSSESYPSMIELLSRFHSSNAFRLIWKEISDRARQVVDDGAFFVLADPEAEAAFIRRIAHGEIDRALERNHGPSGERVARWRFILRHRYPLVNSTLRQLRNLILGKPIPPAPHK
jgi:hypothetical protein